MIPAMDFFSLEEALSFQHGIGETSQARSAALLSLQKRLALSSISPLPGTTTLTGLLGFLSVLFFDASDFFPFLSPGHFFSSFHLSVRRRSFQAAFLAGRRALSSKSL